MKERSRALEGKLSGLIKQARLRLVFVHGAAPDAPFLSHAGRSRHNHHANPK